SIFMEKKMSSIDIKHVIDEIQFLVEGRVDKIYHENREIRIRIYSPKFKDLGEIELLLAPEKIHTTNYRKEMKEPTSFCMFLRKYLKGKIIKGIKQHKLDRIVEIVFEDYILIAELFHRGNFILCDSNYYILMPMEFQKWKGREVLPRKMYKFPESVDPRNINELLQLAKSSKSSIGPFLGNLFGSTYSEEICRRAGIDRTLKITPDIISKIYKIIIELLDKEKKPEMIIENKTPIDATPFPFLMYKGKEKKSFDLFNDALDEFYHILEGEEKKRREKQLEKIVEEKKKRIQEMTKKAIEKYSKEETEKRSKAELIYRNYGLVDSILTRLREVREKLDWSEIKSIIQREDSPEANSIKEIREHEGIVVVNLEGKDIELYINKSIEGNAALYYEEAKKAKSKKERTEKVPKEDIEKKIEEDVKKKKPKERKVKKRKRWYEKFRWFVSSDGFLIVLGKDAKTNEELIKKYAKPEDIVLHAEVKGGAFALVKARIDGRYKPREITPVAIKEAGQMAACYSKAWSLGLGSVQVYWVRPDQLTKAAPAGQYLEKGSFLVKGEKNYLKKLSLRLTIGVKDGKVIAGPVEAVAKKTRYFVTVQPGRTPSRELAKQIKQKLLEKCMPEDKEWIRAIPEDEIAKHVPSGEGDLFLGF
ncbi:MAG: NFACT family protein, partial [Candidatus Aenigmarchaeota archaeon]|nr:NFACT family protein [Candidatus Aenigmarchaeota archaeon]